MRSLGARIIGTTTLCDTSDAADSRLLSTVERIAETSAPANST